MGSFFFLPLGLCAPSATPSASSTAAPAPPGATRRARPATGIDVPIVPYKATGEVVIAAKNGDAYLVFDILAPAISHIRSGNLRAIAVTPAKRFPGLAEVPTVIEGGVPGYEVTSWNGLAAPAKTPRPIVERLHRAVVSALTSPEVQKRLAELGVEGRASTPEQLSEFFVSEAQRWTRVVERAKIPKQ